MLIIKRRQGQAIDVGNNVRIILQEIHSGQVKIGIVAPRQVRVKRSEISHEITEENKKAAQSCLVVKEGLGVVADIEDLFRISDRSEE